VRDLVDSICEVSDDEIKAAMRLLWNRLKIVVEPSSATTLAAVLSKRDATLTSCSRIALVLTGGNIDFPA
jgi:threonine dehydratase